MGSTSTCGTIWYWWEVTSENASISKWTYCNRFCVDQVSHTLRCKKTQNKFIKSSEFFFVKVYMVLHEEHLTDVIEFRRLGPSPQVSFEEHFSDVCDNGRVCFRFMRPLASRLTASSKIAGRALTDIIPKQSIATSTINLFPMSAFFEAFSILITLFKSDSRVLSDFNIFPMDTGLMTENVVMLTLLLILNAAMSTRLASCGDGNRTMGNLRRNAYPIRENERILRICHVVYRGLWGWTKWSVGWNLVNDYTQVC